MGGGRGLVAEGVRAGGRGRAAGGQKDRLDLTTAELLAFAPEEDVRLPRKLGAQVTEPEQLRPKADRVPAGRSRQRPEPVRRTFEQTMLRGQLTRPGRGG